GPPVPGSSANARHSVTATAEYVVPFPFAEKVARRRDVVTGSNVTVLNAVVLVPYVDGFATGAQDCAVSSQYSSTHESGRTTPSPVPGSESRQNFSSAPVSRIGRDQSYRTHCVAGRVPDHVPQIWA